MSGRLGWVVVRWNQTGGAPNIHSDLYHDTADAGRVRDDLQADARRIGRRDRYSLATVELPEED